MIRTKTVFSISLTFCLSAILVVFCYSPVPAKEVKFPTPSYEGEELAKVKEWEKTSVGKKVSTAEVDQVKDLLPESVYTIMKKPKDFGAEGDIWFEVVPYREYKISPGLIEATKQFAPTAQFDAKLNLMNYGKVAGIPFKSSADTSAAATRRERR